MLGLIEISNKSHVKKKIDEDLSNNSVGLVYDTRLRKEVESLLTDEKQYKLAAAFYSLN